jgi:hypothetical protein
MQEYYGLDEERARRKAHNYIESGADIMLLSDEPGVQDRLRAAVGQIDQAGIAQILGEYLDRSTIHGSIPAALSSFYTGFTSQDFTRIDAWAEFWRGLEVRMDLKDIGHDRRVECLALSADITRGTYQQFLAYSLERGSARLTSG